MILVDSSVWIGWFNGHSTRATAALDRFLGSEPLLIGDLVLAEVLQGFRRDEDYREALRLLSALRPVDLCGHGIALRVAEHDRALRRAGVTVRKTVDMFIGTWCIVHQCPLLHDDRDFRPLEVHLGLEPAC